MALGIDNPELQITVGYQIDPSSLTKLKQIAGEGVGIYSQAKVKEEEISKVTEAKKTQIAELGEARRLQKQKDFLLKQEQAQIAANERILQRQTSWSARMAKSFETLAFAAKAYLTVQATQLIKGSLEFTGRLADQADAVGLNVRQFYALKEAAANVDVESEKVEKILTRINLALETPNEKQATLFARLGVDITQGAAPALDKLLTGVQNGRVSLSDLADIVDGKSVLAFRKLALEVGSLDEAQRKFVLGISDDEIRKVDKFTDSIARGWDKANIALGHYFAKFLELEAKAHFGGAANSVSPEKLIPKDSPLGELFGPNLTDAQRKQLEYRSKINDAVKSQLEGLQFQLDLEKAITAELQRRSGSAVGSFGFQSRTLTPQGQGNLQERTGQLFYREYARLFEETEDRKKQKAKETAEALEKQNDILEKQRQKLQNVVSVMNDLSGVASALNDLNSVYYQNQIQQQEFLIQREEERWQAREAFLERAGLSTSRTYQRERQVHDANVKAMMKTEMQIKSKAWESEKGARETGVLMNTAQAVMAAFTLVPPNSALTAIMAALATAQGALQFAAIEAQQNPYKGYARGGWIVGSQQGDNIPIRATAGEFVVSADNARRNAEALQFMNSGGSSGGGGVTININAPIIGTDEFVQNNLIPSLRRASRNGYNNPFVN